MRTLAALLIATTLWAQEAGDVVHDKDIELDADAVVRVRIISGDIKIRSGAKAHVKVVRSGADRRNLEVKLESTRKLLEIGAHYPEAGPFRMDASAQVEITLPPVVKSVTLSSVSGPIDIDGATASEIKLNTVNGTIKVARVKGDLEATSTSGNVSITELSCKSAKFMVTSGKIEGSGKVESLEVTTVSGAIDFHLEPPKEGAWSARATAVSGDITIRLPNGLGAKLSSSTLNGTITCDFPLKDRAGEKPVVGFDMSGVFGTGAGTLNIRTINGTISIKAVK